MDYTQDTTKHTKGKHFSYGDRRELQGMLSNKSVRYSLRQLARHFNCAPNTIRNELKRGAHHNTCLLYTSPSPRDGLLSRMPSSA